MSQNQEKLYIDVDEEITTVVDRLRHSPAQSVAVVVPQRSVLLQSIVNLKLLAREAKKLGKSLVLMTKDEEGIIFASRAGIEVQPFVGSEENMMQQDLQNQNYFSATPYNDNQQSAENFFQDEDVALQNFGGQEEVGEQNDYEEVRARPSMDVQVRRKKRVVSDSLKAPQYEKTQEHPIEERDFQESTDFVDYSSQNQHDSFQDKQQSFNESANDNFYNQEQNYEEDSYYSSNNQDHSQDFNQKQSGFYDEPEPLYDSPQYSNVNHRDNNPVRSFESVPTYSSRNNSKSQEKEKRSWFSKNDNKEEKKTSLSSKKQKKDRNESPIFFSKWIIVGGLLIIFFIGAFIVFPKTTLVVKIKEVNIEEKISLTAKTDQEEIDGERMTIPARQINKQIIYTKSFKSTGKADVDAQKAQGMVTIFNEYSEDDYKLVKTTRFLSKDGTLFRLANNVTVPGATEVDGNKEPGKVKALLVADKSGEVGNIEATTFRVAAFKDSDKYDKFYAESKSGMQGGGVGGENMPIVTEDDIKNAKEIMEKSMPAFVESEIADLVRDEEVLSKDAIDYKISSLGAKVAKDTAVAEFEYEIAVGVSALVFSQKDVNELVYSVVNEKNKGTEIDQNNIDVKYNSFKPEFDAGNLKMVADAVAKFKPEFDSDKFKEDIAGKSYEEIGSLVREKYKQIDSDIDSDIFPPIPLMSGKISQVKQMTEVIVE